MQHSKFSCWNHKLSLFSGIIKMVILLCFVVLGFVYPFAVGQTDVTISCSAHSMVVEVPRDITEYYANLTFLDPSCKISSYNESHSKLITTYDRCGTTSKMTETHIIYENQASATVGDANEIISRQSNFTIKLVCKLRRRVNAPLGNENVIVHPSGQSQNSKNERATILAQEEVFNNTVIMINMFDQNQTSRLNNNNDFPIKVHVTDTLNFELSILTKNPTVKIATQNCYATKTPDPDLSQKYYIIKEGCPADETLKFSESRKQLNISVKSFIWNDDSSTIFLHCESLLCLLSSNHSSCHYNAGCRHSRQKRRTPGDHLNKAFTTEIKRVKRDVKDAKKEKNSVKDRSEHLYRVSTNRIIVIDDHKEEFSKDDINNESSLNTAGLHGKILLSISISLTLVLVAVFMCLFCYFCKNRREIEKPEQMGYITEVEMLDHLTGKRMSRYSTAYV